MKNHPTLLDQCWQCLTMALVGEELDESDEICGAVFSLCSKVDRIQLWTRSKDDVEKFNSGRMFVTLLDVSEADGIGLEFQVRAPPLRTPYTDLIPCVVSTARKIARFRIGSSLFMPSLSLPFCPTFHNNKTGSPVSSSGEGPGPSPSPASAGPGGAFQGFRVNGGVIGSAPGGGGWHAKRSGQSTS